MELDAGSMVAGHWAYGRRFANPPVRGEYVL
jgi:hypothetical protein